VIGDQGRVLKSIATAYRGMKHHRLRLLASYVSIALWAGAVLAAGIWFWIKLVPAASVLGAFLVGQAILLIVLAARFWQRACAVAFYLDQMVAPIAEMQPLPAESAAIVAMVDEGGPAPLPQT
jgi:hypothetical protein